MLNDCLIEHIIHYEFGSCKNMTTSTDMWVPVKDLSPSPSSNFQVQVKDLCRSRNQTDRELHILQPQLTLNTLMQRNTNCN